ncbi:hypothetical protein RUND412_003422 [Rhizina undulata]
MSEQQQEPSSSPGSTTSAPMGSPTDHHDITAPSVLPSSDSSLLRPSTPMTATDPVSRSQSPAKRLKSEDPPSTIVPSIETPEPMDEDIQPMQSNRGASVEMIDINVASSENGGVATNMSSSSSSIAPSTIATSVFTQTTQATSVSSIPPPPLPEQVRSINDAVLGGELKEGEEWYIISGPWFKKFLAQAPEISGIHPSKDDEETEELGPIDTSVLVDAVQQEQISKRSKDSMLSLSFISPESGGKLLRGMEKLSLQDGGEAESMDHANSVFFHSEETTTDGNTDSEFIPIKLGTLEEDFYLLPPDAWNNLVSWYGLAKDSPVISRRVVNTAEAGAPQNLQAELFPPTFTVYKLRNPSAKVTNVILDGEKSQSPKKVVAGKSEGFQKFLKKVKALAGVEPGRKIRLWRIRGSGSNDVEGLPKASKKVGKDKEPGLLKQMVIDLRDFKPLLVGSERELLDIADLSDDPKYNGSMRIDMAGLGEGGAILIDEQMSDGEWSSESTNVKVAKRFGHSITVTQHGTASANTPKKKPIAPSASPRSASPAPSVASSSSASKSSALLTRAREKKDGRPPGKCGLSNLGNSCYMNSALQCLRSVEELSRYFLSDEYEKELNPGNPLAHNGKVAKAYASLLKNIFSPTCPSSFAPREFKSTIGRFGPSFSGYGQQDSQEFLAFLLDGLHEDLNRIQQKPYIEKPESTDEMVGKNEAIAKLAEEHWNIYKKRNDSAVADLFGGLYQSTLVCPECEKVSITFDPFMDLTLPLPVANFWSKEIYFFPKDASKSRMLRVSVEMEKNNSLKSLKEYIGRKMGVDPNMIMGSEVYKSKFYKHYDDFSSISDQISINDDAYFFELDGIPSNYPPPNTKKSKKFNRGLFSRYDEDDEMDTDAPEWDKLLVPVFHRAPKTKFNGKSLESFGVPFFILLDREEATNAETIMEKIIEKYQVMTSRDLYEDIPVAEEEQEAEEDVAEEDLTEKDEIDGELKDGFVDVSMKDEEILEAGLGTRNSSKRKLPQAVYDLFSLKITKSKAQGSSVPTGWQGFDNCIDISQRLGRASPPSPPARKIQAFDSAVNSGRLSPASNASIEATDRFEDAPEPQTDIMNDNSDDEDDVNNSSDNLLSRQPRPQYTDFGTIAPDDFYGNSSANSFKNFKTPSRSLSPPVYEGLLVRWGEGFVCDWTAESYDAIFGGKHSDDFRGHDKSTNVPLFHDEELDQRRRHREDRRQKGIHLEDCLDEFAKNEILSEEDPWYCPRCKEHRRASKKFELWKCPDILVVHLKRFSSSRNFRDKIDALIDCPVEGLDLTNRVGLKEDGKSLVYDLFAVDNHYGGLGGGHYTAFAKNWIDGKWYYCDDSSVREVSDTDRIITAAAYLLFYRRRSSKSLGGPEFERIHTAAVDNTADLPELGNNSSRESSPAGRCLTGGGGPSDDSSISITVNGIHRKTSSGGLGNGCGMFADVGNNNLWNPSGKVTTAAIEDDDEKPPAYDANDAIELPDYPEAVAAPNVGFVFGPVNPEKVLDEGIIEDVEMTGEVLEVPVEGEEDSEVQEVKLGEGESE